MENIYTYQARLHEFSYKRVELNSECCAHCVSNMTLKDKDWGHVDLS